MRYQKIDSRIWNDEKFVQLTPMQQRLFLYVLTCPHSNLIGIFILKKAYIIEDLKCVPKAFETDFEQLRNAGFIDYDEATNMVWVKNFLKYNLLRNPNQFKAVPKILADLPKSKLIQKFIEKNRAYLNGVLDEFETHFETHSERQRNKDSDSDSETDSETEDEGPSGPLSSSDDADPVIRTEEPPGNGKKPIPDCPVSKIIERYHTILPAFAKVQVIDKTTRSNIRNRWHEDPQRWALEWWDDFFNYVGASDFLSGRKTDFKANFTWLVGPKNFAKVLNGAYDNHRCALGPKAQRNMAAADAVKRMIDEGKL